MKMIILNGTSYPAKEITFNDFCTFEDMGIDIQTMDKKPLSFLRTYIALCMKNTDFVDASLLDKAGTEIEKHIENGGSIEDLLESMSEAIQNSGFFRPQLSTTEKETPKSEEQKKE